MVGQHQDSILLCLLQQHGRRKRVFSRARVKRRVETRGVEGENIEEKNMIGVILRELGGFESGLSMICVLLEKFVYCILKNTVFEIRNGHYMGMQ